MIYNLQNANLWKIASLKVVLLSPPIWKHVPEWKGGVLMIYSRRTVLWTGMQISYCDIFGAEFSNIIFNWFLNIHLDHLINILRLSFSYLLSSILYALPNDTKFAFFLCKCQMSVQICTKFGHSFAPLDMSYLQDDVRRIWLSHDPQTQPSVQSSSPPMVISPEAIACQSQIWHRYKGLRAHLKASIRSTRSCVCKSKYRPLNLIKLFVEVEVFIWTFENICIIVPEAVS